MARVNRTGYELPRRPASPKKGENQAPSQSREERNPYHPSEPAVDKLAPRQVPGNTWQLCACILKVIRLPSLGTLAVSNQQANEDQQEKVACRNQPWGINDHNRARNTDPGCNRADQDDPSAARCEEIVKGKAA